MLLLLNSSTTPSENLVLLTMTWTFASIFDTVWREGKDSQIMMEELKFGEWLSDLNLANPLIIEFLLIMNILKYSLSLKI